MTACLHLIIFLAIPPANAESFASWSIKAEKAKQRGETAVALEAWSNALRLWKRSDGGARKAKAHSQRAMILDETGETSMAVAEMSRAVALAPRSAALFLQRGRLLMKEGKLTEAISDFYSATKINLNDAPAYFERAQAYERQGDRKFAAEDFRTACRLGLKAACGRGKATATAPESSPGPKARRPLDFNACLDAIDACGEAGNSVGICVKRAKICEVSDVKGCCPNACVKEFNLAATANRSDAELFRRHFSVKSACLKAGP